VGLSLGGLCCSRHHVRQQHVIQAGIGLHGCRHRGNFRSLCWDSFRLGRGWSLNQGLRVGVGRAAVLNFWVTGSHILWVQVTALVNTVITCINILHIM